VIHYHEKRYTMRKNALLGLFVCLFVAGLVLISRAETIAERQSRSYIDSVPNGWTTNMDEVERRTKPPLLGGAVIALVGGYGAVRVVTAKVE
jgi:hypothetical protein